MGEFAVILPAAGNSSRYGSRNKLTEDLCGRPVVLRSIDAFAARAQRDVKLILVPADYRMRHWLSPRLHDYDRELVQLCPGGDCRAASVLSGLQHVPEDIEWVAVHDAARPLVSAAVIDRTFAAALEHGAAAAAMPVTLTIRQATGPLPARAGCTIPRQRLCAMQTPQAMRRIDLLEAFSACPLPLEQVTDDLQLLELANRPVWLVAGDDANIKITTPQDMLLARAILAARP